MIVVNVPLIRKLSLPRFDRRNLPATFVFQRRHAEEQIVLVMHDCSDSVPFRLWCLFFIIRQIDRAVQGAVELNSNRRRLPLRPGFTRSHNWVDSPLEWTDVQVERATAESCN